MLGRRWGTENTLAFRLASITLSPGFRFLHKRENNYYIITFHRFNMLCYKIKFFLLYIAIINEIFLTF